MALVDLAAFRVTCPEFVRVSDAQVQDALDKAAVSTPSDPWFEHQEEGHTMLAAHLLAQSPFGMNARLEGEPTSTYGERFERLKMLVGCGARVI
jgi:hypothetical protein